MSFCFSYGKLSFEQVRRFLMDTDKEFPTPLSAHVDIDAYAKKLSEFSDFSICWNGGDIIGMISCYTNRPPLGYISNVCIKKEYQGKRVFRRLFFDLIARLTEKGFNRIQLEVDLDNIRALAIYHHLGFKEVQNTGDGRKLLLEFCF